MIQPYHSTDREGPLYVTVGFCMLIAFCLLIGFSIYKNRLKEEKIDQEINKGVQALMRGIEGDCSSLKEAKHILRLIAKQLCVADFIIERPKSGFGIAPSKWANKGGIFEPLIPLASKCFDKNIIRHFQSVEPKNAMTFWNILNYWSYPEDRCIVESFKSILPID